MKDTSVLFICMGNICRSPAAHGVMQHFCAEQGLKWKIDSCGTLGYHQGSPPDRRMQAVLKQHGINFKHKAQPFRLGMAYEFDLLLAMDRQNYEDIRQTIEDALDEEEAAPLLAKLQMFRDFDPKASPADCQVPDPYYNGDESFREVYEMIERSCRGILAKLLA